MTKNESLNVTDSRIILKGDGFSSVRAVVDEVKRKGWTTLKASGDLELRRALWLEGSMRGITVNGYDPTAHDKELISQMTKSKREEGDLRLRASDVVRDFSDRVIPKLKREYDQLRKNRREAGITTTELDRAYGLNKTATYRRDLDDRFYRVKSAMVRAMSDLEQFRACGNRTVQVRQSFEDGVARFVMVAGEQGGAIGYEKRLGNRRY